jgi:hypothetical protein
MSSYTVRIIFLIGFILSAALLIQAQTPTRTWVSGVGDDANACSRTTPCKTFAVAITKTAANGEINCLDSGGFGTVTVTKAITIDCTGNYGSILATSNTSGITINAAQNVVRLRGLSITGQNQGLNGILITSAGRVIIEDTVIDGFVNNGITLSNTFASALYVSNSNVRNNNGSGIYIAPLGTVAATAAVFNTRIIGNNNTGINAQLSDVAVTNCLISGNGTGIYASNGGNIRISGNNISENNIGMMIITGTIKTQIVSYSNNAISGNTTTGSAPNATQGLQ